MRNLPSPRDLARAFSVAIIFIAHAATAQEFLYGITQTGGTNTFGTAYRITTDGLEYNSFGDLPEAISPGYGGSSGFMEFSGVLLTLSENTRHRIYSNQSGITASGTPGAKSSGTVVLGNDAKAYGMTWNGGTSNNGTIFRGEVTLPSQSVYFNFDGANNGRAPRGNLTLGPDGKLFGMTELGGSNDKGVIFSITTFTPTAFKKLIDFNGTNGANPVGSLILASDGYLYGMTKAGGANNQGVIFKIAVDGTGYTKLLDFNSASTGATPLGSLVQFTDGKLYGMTSTGGANNFGTVFSIATNGTFSKIADFNGSNGKNPTGDLLVSTSGTVMYGTARNGGANDLGTLFKLQNGTFTKIYDFGTNGSHPIGTLSMLRAEHTLTFPAIEPRDLLQQPFTPVATSPTGTPVFFCVTNPSSAIVENGQVKNIAQASVDIDAYHPGNYKYRPAVKAPSQGGDYGGRTQTLSIVKGHQTITFEKITHKTYLDGSFDLVATSNSGLPIRFESSRSSRLVIFDNHATITGAGTVTVTAYQDGNQWFYPAEASQEITIAKVDQTITVGNIAPVECCQPFHIPASVSSGLDLSLRAISPEIASGSSDLYIRPNLVGTAEFVIYQPGDDDHNPVETTATVQIVKGHQSIIQTSLLPEYTFGTGPFDAGIYSTGNKVVVTSDFPGVATIEDNKIYLLGEGETTITLTQPGDDRYLAGTPYTKKITVKPGVGIPKTNEIIWDSYPSYDTYYTTTYGYINLLGYTTAGLPVIYTSSDASIASIKGNQVTIKKSGSVVITASNAGGAGFPPAEPVSKDLIISKDIQFLYWPGDLTLDQSPVKLADYSSVGLPVTYQSSDESIFKIVDNMLYLVNAGTATLTMSQAGNDTYQQVSSPVNLSVDRTPHTIIFPPMEPKKVGDPPFIPVATSTSGLPVTFTSENAFIAKANGRIITTKGAGTVEITAHQEGNDRYGIADEVTQILTITKGSQVIDFPSVPDKTFGDPSFTVTAKSNSGLPVKFSTTTPGVIKISGNIVMMVGSGVASITASQAGSNDYEAASVTNTFKITDRASNYPMVVSAANGGPNVNGYIFETSSSSPAINPVKVFAKRNNVTPRSGFVKASDGKLYVNTENGGDHGLGQIIRLDADGSNYTSVFSYNSQSGGGAYAELTEGSDGYFYTTTMIGGKYQKGTIVKIKKDGSEFRVLHDFSATDGSRVEGGLCLASDGKLYGATGSGGFFWYGVVFSINQDGTGYNVVLKFDENAYSPHAKIVQGPDQSFYLALTSSDNFSIHGSVIKFTAAGASQTLVAFTNTNNGYGPTSAPLVGTDGKLYGTTQFGGVNNLGILYTMNTDGTGFAKLYDFNEASGSRPAGPLTEASDGLLYGVASFGGANDYGVAYKVQKNGAGYTVLTDLEGFNADDTYYGEESSYCKLLEASAGTFFGTSVVGGPSSSGYLFKVTSAGAYNIIKDYAEEEGGPYNVVHDATGEHYYGIAIMPKAGTKGNAFSMNADGSDYKSILDFDETVSARYLTYVSTGHLWGFGGPFDAEYIFRMNTDGTGREVLFTFDNVAIKGSKPVKLIESEEYIYGMTAAGGPTNLGVLFRFNKNGTGYVKLGNVFSEQNTGGVKDFILGSDELFYGITQGDGMLFSMTAFGEITNIRYFSEYTALNQIMELNSGNLAIQADADLLIVSKDGKSVSSIYKFNEEQGRRPLHMRHDADGWIYISTDLGSTYKKGSLFKIRPDGTGYTRILDFNPDNGYSAYGFFFKKSYQTFSVASIPQKKLSDPPFVPETITSSGSRVQFGSADPSIAEVKNGMIVPASVGTTTIFVTLPDNENFYGSQEMIERELVIIKGDQTIDFKPLPFARLSELTVELTAEVNSGLPITYTSSNPAVATIEDNMVILHQRGQTTIKASQAGNDQYNAAADVQQVLKVYGDGIQYITFGAIEDQTLGDPSLTLTSTASSGLAVTLSATTSNISLSGNELSFIAAGHATVQANQTGNEEWLPADPISQIFCINPPKPEITIAPTFSTIVLTSSNDEGNHWYKDGQLIEDITDKTVTAFEEGAYSVQTIIDGCVSEKSDDVVALFTLPTGLEDIQASIDLYPNPATRELVLKIEGDHSTAQLKLINELGQVVLSRTGSGQTIDIHHLAPGLYIARIEIGNQVIFKRIAKN